MTITRRTFAAAGAGALLAGCGAPQPIAMPAPRDRNFGSDFIWGVANAALQSEGALNADGRGPSVWDVFARERVHDGSDASVATDSYRRYAEDAALAAELGVQAFRFSISWPRIFPEGGGALNEAGVDHYSRVVDDLLARGVTPYATLFHWDLPQALQQSIGGWASRDTAERFADYARIIGERLGDRLKHIIVMNEPAVHAVLGYVLGEHAPGLTDASALGPVIHHENLAQGLAIQALRASQRDLTIGTTLSLMPVRPAKDGFAPANKLAADGFNEIWNGGFLDPLLKGSYPATARDMVGDALRDGDLAIIQQPIDFLGVNYYAPTYIAFDLNAPSHIKLAPPPRGVELDAFGRHVDPAGLFELLTKLHADYGAPRMLVTENGCSDPFSDDPGIIDDQFRITFLRRHLEAVKSAMEAGAQIGGYFHWTLIDNWEWAEGYRSKFGLVAMDRASGVRTPKASYAWYKALAAGGVLDA
jgi:beta-glucosidase